MVPQNYRFGRQPRTTHRLLKEGIVGKPAQVNMVFYKAWATRPGTHYTTMPYPLITDMGVHHFDLLRYVLSQEPVRVYAKTWNPPSEQAKREKLPLDDLDMTGQDALLAEFVAAVNEGREPECSGQDNLKSLAMVFAAIQSSKEERPVKIAELL